MPDLCCRKYAVESTFFVHVFLVSGSARTHAHLLTHALQGDFDSDPDNWSTDKNLVGSHVVFTSNPGTSCEKCISDRERGTVVTGTIPLTGALGDKFGNVYDLKPETIAPYLTSTLHWRVAKVRANLVDDLEIC